MICASEPPSKEWVNPAVWAIYLYIVTRFLLGIPENIGIRVPFLLRQLKMAGFSGSNKWMDIGSPQRLELPWYVFFFKKLPVVGFQ